MQKVLSLLMAFLLLEVQARALSGGPVFGSAQGLNVVGTYAGVLVPVSESTQLDIATTQSHAASIGLFSLGVPDAGPSTGGVVVFVEGTSFNGNLTGVADPGDGSFQAIVDATSSYTISFPVDTNGDGTIDNVIDTNVFAQGSIDAVIVSDFVTSNIFTGPTPGATRVSGTAAIDVFYLLQDDGTPDVSNTAHYEVDGFKQSDTVSQVNFTVGQFDFSNTNNNNNNNTNNNTTP